MAKGVGAWNLDKGEIKEDLIASTLPAVLLLLTVFIIQRLKNVLLFHV